MTEVIETSQRWWKAKGWTRTGWARRRGLGRWLAALEEEDGHVDAFFDRERHQGSVVYAWGPADGAGDVYIGSTVTAMFGGASKGDRAWSHLAHVRSHRRGTCLCRSKLYCAAAGAPHIGAWVLIPLVILPGASQSTIRRVESTLIKQLHPRLNTIGVTWTGREARKVKKPRRIPAQRRIGGDGIKALDQPL